MTNPFFNRGPIREPRFYFARPRETREILRLVAGSQNCSLVGPVKSGKTSLLLHLARPGTLAAQGICPEHTAAVYLSLEGLGGLTAEQFFHLMVRETARQVHGRVALVWPRLEAQDAVTFLELREVLDRIEGEGGSIIYLLDELELAAANPAFDLNFFSALRHVAARPRVCFVTATERPLHELEIAGREVGSPFADLFSVVRMQPAPDEAGWAWVHALALEAGVDLTPAREVILELGRGWPYYLQVAAFEVFEQVAHSAGGALGEEQRVYVRSRVAEQLEPVLAMLWDRLDEADRARALAALDGDAAAREVGGLTISRQGRVAPANAIVGDFLAARGRDQAFSALPFAVEEPSEPDLAMIYSVVRTLVRAVEARDRYVRGHSDAVARLAVVIAQELGWPPEAVEALRMAARLHDIGRVSISDVILLKPAPLSELETEIVRTHPLVAAQILDALEFPWSVKPAVRYHHERLDGTGYPEGLMGEEIPLGARILAVADVMSAMTSDRPYRAALSREEALAELAQNAGAKYDERAVAALERALTRGAA